MVKNVASSCLENDTYAAYNKPYALAQWLRATKPPKDSVILIVDPDFLFRQPVAMDPVEGHPVAQDWRFDLAHGPWLDGQEFLLQTHCRRHRELAQIVGVPCALTAGDAELIVDRWLAITIEIRASARSREAAGWIAEMWAYMIAAAEAGLRHTVVGAASTLVHEFEGSSMVHYTGSTTAFDKHLYRPWEHPPALPADCNKSSAQVWQAVADYAASRR